VNPPTLSAGQTPLARAVEIVIGSYRAACQTLTAAERDVLRDIIATRLAADWLEQLGVLDEEERAA
jgi:hypothetical protein